MYSLLSFTACAAALLVPSVICAPAPQQCASLHSSPFYLMVQSHGGDKDGTYLAINQDTLFLAATFPLSEAAEFILHPGGNMTSSIAPGRVLQACIPDNYPTLMVGRSLTFTNTWCSGGPLHCAVSASCEWTCHAFDHGLNYDIIGMTHNPRFNGILKLQTNQSDVADLYPTFVAVPIAAA